jgi:hypothetical protein
MNASGGITGMFAAGMLTVLICVGAFSAPALYDRQPSPPSAAGAREESSAESEDACHQTLQGAGVAFRTLRHEDAPGIAWPVLLTGPVAGVTIRGNAPSPAGEYLDCRLAMALLGWAPRLRELGVVKLTHYSLYRQDAVIGDTSKASGHAHGMAIDVGLLELRDGRKLSVQDDWTQRTRGKDPCASSLLDSDNGHALRALTCDPTTRQLFQIVLTPHYDEAHGNHVHLEVAPAAAAYVH